MMNCLEIYLLDEKEREKEKNTQIPMNKMQFIDLKSGCYDIGSGKWYGDFVYVCFFFAKNAKQVCSIIR